MKMIRAFIRPEKEQEVVLALEGAGFPSLTKVPVFGRGKQKGLTVGPVHYDELPKVLIMTVVDDNDLDKVMKVIQDKARTGFIGDGKIFISPVESRLYGQDRRSEACSGIADFGLRIADCGIRTVKKGRSRAIINIVRHSRESGNPGSILASLDSGSSPE